MTLNPSTTSVTVGTRTTFVCVPNVNDELVISFEWSVNGEPQGQFDGSQIETFVSESLDLSWLAFVAPQMENNGSMVRCQIHFSSGLPVDSNDGLLIVLG